MNTRELEIINAQIFRLKKLAKELHKLAETQCEFGLSRTQEKTQNNMVKTAKLTAKEMGFEFYFGGDPRGSMFVLTEEKNKSYFEVNDGVYF